MDKTENNKTESSMKPVIKVVILILAMFIVVYGLRRKEMVENSKPASSQDLQELENLAKGDRESVTFLKESLTENPKPNKFRFNIIKEKIEILKKQRQKD